jgi:hypothetical protein
MLLVLLFNIGGVFVVFKIQQYSARKEMKRKIKESLHSSDLLVISISESDTVQPDWQDDHEFRYKDTMYDVVRTKHIASTTFYYCINDEKESVLFDHLDEELQKDENSSKAGGLMKNLLSLLSNMHIPLRSNMQAPFEQTLIYLINPDCFISQVFQGIPTPPPDFV